MTQAMQRPVVLIVEDEPLILLNAVDIATDAGFDVIEAGSADEAIEVLESRDDICLIFTDVRMPGSMDGLMLAHAVAERWPPIKLVVTSGHVRAGDSELPPGGRFLAKPYEPWRMAEALRSMVQSAA
jgi:two-component system, response regulator PdtaR